MGFDDFRDCQEICKYLLRYDKLPVENRITLHGYLVRGPSYKFPLRLKYFSLCDIQAQATSNGESILHIQECLDIFDAMEKQDARRPINLDWRLRGELEDQLDWIRQHPDGSEPKQFRDVTKSKSEPDATGRKKR